MAAGNTFGTLLKITLFGESHGAAVGGVLDGFPAGQRVHHALISEMLKQRAPGGFSHETSRAETDIVEFLSGIENDKTLGSPVAFIIRNMDAHSEDYNDTKNVFRPGHADYTYHRKYGLLPQAGGGRASGRETAARVVAGAFALDFLRSKGIDISSYVSAIGSVKMNGAGKWYDEKAVQSSAVRCPDQAASNQIEILLKEISKKKDSVGGCITTTVSGLPAGLGEPVFGKINAVLSQAVMSIPGAKGVDFGEGFAGIALHGSEYNDVPENKDGKISFLSNHSGGIQAGISNGNLLVMNTAFRPASSIGTPQHSVDFNGNETELTVSGRHDACFVPRAAVVVTAMAAMAIADLWLQFKSYDREL